MKRGDSIGENTGPESALIRSALLHAVLLATATLAAWLPLGFSGMPLSWDPAYFTYMGQMVLRGDAVYSHTFMAYPPMGPLLSAASMVVGGWFDVPSYLAPRYLALACGVGSVLLVYFVTRRATDDPWAGLVAGLILAGIHHLARSSLATLEPKHLVIFFSLAAAAACQRQRWRLAGGAAAFAVTCYQPAVLVPAVFGLIALRNGRRRGFKIPIAYATGFAVGLLPTWVYLTATGGWRDFWVRAVLLTSAARLPTAGERPLHWLAVLKSSYASEIPFFVAAGVGWVTYALASARRGRGERLGAWLDTQSAGMPLLGGLVFAYVVVDCQGYPDIYALLPFVAFWAAWLSHRLTQISVKRLRSRPSPAALLPRGLGAAWILLAAWTGFRDLPSQPRRQFLPRQLAAVQQIVGSPDDTVMAFFSAEVYVLSERRSPLPFLRLPGIFVPFLTYAGFRDCTDVAERVVAQRPRAVALRIELLQGGCEPLIARRLLANAYERQPVPFGPVIYWRADVVRKPLASPFRTGE